MSWTTRYRLLALVVAVTGATGIASDAAATHFRFAHTSWRRVQGTTVEFTSTQAWRADAVFPGELAIDPGEGPVLPTPAHETVGTFTDLAGESYTIVRFRVQHTYSGEGPFTAVQQSCCRISSLVNAGDAGERIETVVDLRNGNQGSPVSSIPAILQFPRGPRNVPLPIGDPDGGPASCRMATLAESQIPSVAQAGGNVLEVSSDCRLSWDASAAPVGSKYAVQVAIEEIGRAGRVALDFIVEIVATDVNDSPTCALDSELDEFVLPVGTPFSIGMTGEDRNGDDLAISHLGLPPGATLTPPQGTSGPQPFAATFEWTPALSDAGSAHAVTVAFTDPEGLESSPSCSFSLRVPATDFNPPSCSLEPAGDGVVLFSGRAEDSRPSEDVNGNGVLDPGEDLNGNGVIDADTGVASVALAPRAVNLEIELRAPLGAVVDFDVVRTDSGAPARGTVRVTDAVGNATTCEPEVEVAISNPAVRAGGVWVEGVGTYSGSGMTTAFLAARERGLISFDVTDPQDPKPIGLAAPTAEQCPAGFFFDDLEVVGHAAFIAGGRCGLLIADVAASATPGPGGIFDQPQWAKDVAVSRGRAAAGIALEGGAPVAYVADYFGGLWIVEVVEGADSTLGFRSERIGIGDGGLVGAPVAVASEETVSGNRAYVATTQGLFVVDPALPVGDELAPTILGSCTTNPDGLALEAQTHVPQDVAVRDGFAYLPLWVGGLLVVDVRAPSTLAGACAGEFLAAGAAAPADAGDRSQQAFYKAAVSQAGDRLYVTEGQCGLGVFDIVGGALAEIGVSRVPIAGGHDCDATAPPDPLDPSVPFAWAVHEAEGHVAVVWGRLEPREGGIQVVEFANRAGGTSGLVRAESDADGDGVPDPGDNCLLEPNPSQLDSDLDGFGNACDADYDNNGVVSGIDYTRLRGEFELRQGDPGFDPALDADGNGRFGGPEIRLLRHSIGLAPGPSGLACAGTAPCR